MIIEYLELGEKAQLPLKIEWIVLQYALQWVQSDYMDIRCNAARILMALFRNPEREYSTASGLAEVEAQGVLHCFSGGNTVK
ncbi:MAG: hypothetical protein HFI63_01475 [Lachnospiraceae bacterium]|nr:hypothetical protein [Lachnospiraceae bacterium]